MEAEDKYGQRMNKREKRGVQHEGILRTEGARAPATGEVILVFTVYVLPGVLGTAEMLASPADDGGDGPERENRTAADMGRANEEGRAMKCGGAGEGCMGTMQVQYTYSMRNAQTNSTRERRIRRIMNTRILGWKVTY